MLLFLSGKIIELVEQSKGWSSVDHTTDIAENVMKGITEEELYNLPTSEYVHRRGGFLFRQLTVYHVAFQACASLGDVQVISEWYSAVYSWAALLHPFLIAFSYRSKPSWLDNVQTCVYATCGLCLVRLLTHLLSDFNLYTHLSSEFN